MILKAIVVFLLALFPACLHAQEKGFVLPPDNFNKEKVQIDSARAGHETPPLLYLKKALILKQQYDYNGALIALNKAIQLDSADLQIVSELADLHTVLGNYKKSLPYFMTIYKRDTTNRINAIRLCNAYLNVRSYKEPYKILLASYAKDSNNLYVNKLLAISAMRTGHDSLAIVLFNKVISQNPTDLNNYLNLATLYQKKEIFSKAIEVLDKGYNVFPDEISLLSRIGDIQFAKRSYGKAAQTYEKFLCSGDSVHEVLKNLGISYYYEKNPQKGLDLLLKCLTLKPNDPVTGLFTGLCYKDLNEIDESIAYLNFASKIATPYYVSDIYNQLGNIYGQRKEYKTSVSWLKKAYSLDTSKCDVLFKIANTYDLWQKDKSPALRYYNAYLKSKKENTEYQQQLTEYALKRKKILEK